MKPPRVGTAVALGLATRLRKMLVTFDARTTGADFRFTGEAVSAWRSDTAAPGTRYDARMDSPSDGTDCEASVTCRVDRSSADQVRELLSARVRLRISEKRGWLRHEFTFTGPEQAVRDADSELKKFLEKCWWDEQW